MTDYDSGKGKGEHGGRFHSAVSSLADGGTVLVASAVPRWVHDQVCEQLLGHPNEPHRRVLGIADPSAESAVADRLPDRAERSPDWLRIVRNDLPSRGGAVADASARSGDPSEPATVNPGPAVDVGQGFLGPSAPETKQMSVETVLNDADVGQFGQTIHEAVRALQSRASDGLSPGELRVCVDDLATLLEREDAAAVAQFVHLIGRRVEVADGLCHVHVTLPPDDPRVKTVAAFVDATVRLRLQEGEPEMQWHLSDGPTSEWIPLSWTAPHTDQP